MDFLLSIFIFVLMHTYINFFSKKHWLLLHTLCFG